MSYSCFIGLLDAVGHTLLLSDRHLVTTRALAQNATSGQVTSAVVWARASVGGTERKVPTDGQIRLGVRPDSSAPWFEDAHTSPALRSPKFMTSPELAAYKGWWTFPYYSCSNKMWMMSYSVVVPPSLKHG